MSVDVITAAQRAHRRKVLARQDKIERHYRPSVHYKMGVPLQKRAPDRHWIDALLLIGGVVLAYLVLVAIEQ